MAATRSTLRSNLRPSSARLYNNRLIVVLSEGLKVINQTHLTDYLKAHAITKSDLPAIIFEGQTLSWSELWRRVEATSFYFSNQLGHDEQKLVNLLLSNSIDFVVAYLSVLHAGHMVLPLDPAYKKLELDAIIDRIPPAMIVIEDRYEKQISHHKTPKISVSDLLKSQAPPAKLLRLPVKKQIASLTFTSGTSGRPKTVPNTHANHIWNIEVCSSVWDWTAQDSLLISLPLSHWYGLVMGLSGALYHGNTLYLQQQAFDAEATLEALASGKISLFTHVPLAYMKMLSADKAANYDLSGVRLCISGGAPLPPPAWREFKDQFGVEIVETYGSSETGRIAANLLSERVLGSPGKVLPGVNVRIGDDGEIQVKSSGQFPGYYRNPAATTAALTPDGYWHTGDLGELKDGYIFLKGRRQERIRRFGYTISPRDVEWALHKNPKINDVFVIGRQQPGQPNDELVYFIVGDITDEEIKDYCKANMLFAWRPDRIIRLDDLPRTRMGKPKLAELKAMAG